jgi:hypothetical protein
MRFLPTLALVAVLLATPVMPASAMPAPTCPSRSAIIDSTKGSATSGDLWLILTGTFWGVPAGIAASLVGAGVSVVSGLRNVDQIDQAVQDNLPALAERLRQSPEDVYEHLQYVEQVMTGDWLMRVAGAAGGSILGLIAPAGLVPMLGMRSTVVISTAGGVTLGGLWHRYALWPFSDDRPDPCGASGGNVIRI